MDKPSRPEIIGVVLLGIALLALSVSLRASQPGVAWVPWWVAPTCAVAIYVIVSLTLAGLRAPAALLFVAMAVTHALYATVMGCAFSVVAPAPSGGMQATVQAGLTSYPPATALQLAFTLPMAIIVLRPWLAPGRDSTDEHCAGLARATCPEELLRCLIAAEDSQSANAAQVIAATVARARCLLDGDAAPEPEEEDTDVPPEHEPVAEPATIEQATEDAPEQPPVTVSHDHAGGCDNEQG